MCVWMCSNVNHFLIFWKTQGFPHSVGGCETAGLIPRPQRPITSQRLLISAPLTLRRDRSPGVALSSTSLQLPGVPHTLSSVRLLGAFPRTLFLAWLDDAKGTVGVTACPPVMVVPPFPSAAGGEVAMTLLTPNLLSSPGSHGFLGEGLHPKSLRGTPSFRLVCSALSSVTVNFMWQLHLAEGGPESWLNISARCV